MNMPSYPSKLWHTSIRSRSSLSSVVTNSSRYGRKRSNSLLHRSPSVIIVFVGRNGYSELQSNLVRVNPGYPELLLDLLWVTLELAPSCSELLKVTFEFARSHSELLGVTLELAPSYPESLPNLLRVTPSHRSWTYSELLRATFEGRCWLFGTCIEKIISPQPFWDWLS